MATLINLAWWLCAFYIWYLAYKLKKQFEDRLHSEIKKIDFIFSYEKFNTSEKNVAHLIVALFLILIIGLFL